MSSHYTFGMLKPEKLTILLPCKTRDDKRVLKGLWKEPVSSLSFSHHTVVSDWNGWKLKVSNKIPEMTNGVVKAGMLVQSDCVKITEEKQKSFNFGFLVILWFMLLCVFVKIYNIVLLFIVISVHHFWYSLFFRLVSHIYFFFYLHYVPPWHISFLCYQVCFP